MQQWACLFIFKPVPDDQREMLRATVEDCDVIWMIAGYQDALEAFKPIRDAVKGKTLVLFREMMMLELVPQRLAELRLFIDEIGSVAERVVIHYPRHRISWDADLERRFPVIRAGTVVPHIFLMNFATRRQLRFIHYQCRYKHLKGSDIVDRLRHLPHIVVGDGLDAIRLSFIEVLHLQAASELLVHPTRADSYSRFVLHGILLGCVPVLLMTDAEMPFVYANATSTDKLAAFRELSRYFPICLDEEAFISTVRHLFAHPERIQEYRQRVGEFLLHHRDLWCPEIIYEIFAEQDLFLPADLMPVTRLGASVNAHPIGKWSQNPLSKCSFWSPTDNYLRREIEPIGTEGGEWHVEFV
jgi:hypothetical protein